MFSGILSRSDTKTESWTAAFKPENGYLFPEAAEMAY